jgi:hypothetical protein
LRLMDTSLRKANLSLSEKPWREVVHLKIPRIIFSDIDENLWRNVYLYFLLNRGGSKSYSRKDSINLRYLYHIHVNN